jgi:hypothetical protein
MTTTTKTTAAIQDFDLGFIGHKAMELQSLFPTYSMKENEFGYFLEFVNYNVLDNNLGVYCLTNCFENEEHFKNVLMSKLLFNL